MRKPHKTKKCPALGVSPDTVGRARKKSTVRFRTVERIGKDGKARGMPKRPDKQSPLKLRPRYDLGPSSDWPLDLQPTSALDLERMEAAKSRVDAMDFDFRRLAKRLRKEARRKQDGRDILADYLEGKLPRPAHRPDHIRQKLAKQMVADFVRVAKQDGVPWSKIIKLAKERFGVSERYVYDAHKNYNMKLAALPKASTARKSNLGPPK
jgi:hypothetical protein